MSREAVNLLVGRAVVDRAFCALLLTRPREAAQEFDLSEAERQLLVRIRAGSLAAFAASLEQLLERAPLPRRGRHGPPLPTGRRASA